MTVSVTSFRLKFDEFAGEDDASIALVIEEAANYVDSSWGTRQDEGQLYYAAHFLMLEIQRAQSATGQAVSSERFGPMSITYQTPSLPTQQNASDLTLTLYGLRIAQLLKLLFPPVMVI